MLTSGLLSIVPIGIFVGALIGCIGVGGVLLVPALTYVGGMSIHMAVTTCMLSYFFSGAVGAYTYAKRGSIRWDMSAWLCLGALPGAFLGAVAVSLSSSLVLEIIISGLIVFSGLHALFGRSEATSERTLGRFALVSVGVVTGFGSAMSGTGGPLVLVPMLIWLKIPVLTAVGLSQVIQVPIALLATLGNALYASVDIPLGLGLAVLLMLGVALGARLAHKVGAQALKRVVATALVGVGILMVSRVVRTLLQAPPAV